MASLSRAAAVTILPLSLRDTDERWLADRLNFKDGSLRVHVGGSENRFPALMIVGSCIALNRTVMRMNTRHNCVCTTTPWHGPCAILHHATGTPCSSFVTETVTQED